MEDRGMSRGRLPEAFRERTKAFAAKIIRLYVRLPKERGEVKNFATEDTERTETEH